MIILNGVSKSYPSIKGKRKILEDINFSVSPGERVGILGRNGAGKSTLLRLMSGVENPSSGEIQREFKVSWPLAFGGAFQSSLTGIDNLKFICRIYGVSFQDKLEFVKEFTELGVYLREPVKRYSTGMRARLSFALSLSVEFDCYLIDEIIAVGDSRFHEKCHYELFEKRRDRAYVLVSHNTHLIQEFCNRAAVLDKGKLHSFTSLNDAFEYYVKEA